VKKEKMKTKTKIVVLAEIAIVLCSMFLVALPAIAAQEQNQEMQEVSASEVTTASEDDSHPLGVYGNGNEDDTIDMGDVVYTKLAIFGKKPKTELCDAKYDGRINVLDVIQTKLIILGKEKELTVIDSADRIVTVSKPVERIVPFIPAEYETLRSLKVPTDRIVSITSGWYWADSVLFPELSEIPRVGKKTDPDIEAILNLQPDVLLLPLSMGNFDRPLIIISKLEDVELTVLAFSCYSYGDLAYDPRFFYPGEVRKLGYIFDKEVEAEEFIDWYESIVNTIDERVEGIPEEDKPKVYFEHNGAYRSRASYPFLIRCAGGIDIFEEHPGRKFDPEAVIAGDPEIIIKLARSDTCGYSMDANDIAKIQEVRDEVMSRPELQREPAVINERVYVWGSTINMDSASPNGARKQFLLPLYWAKWFHPELFKDLDQKAIHQEYLTRFQGLDIDLDKQGVFAYPEPS
jgi:iron complex transport system substrate-binding protein